jgi:hypothetical protein
MAVDITGLSLVVAEMLGTNQAIGGAICSFIFWFTAIITSTIAIGDRKPDNMFLIETFMIFGIVTLIGWLDYWWILMAIGLMAIFGAIKVGQSAG